MQKALDIIIGESPAGALIGIAGAVSSISEDRGANEALTGLWAGPLGLRPVGLGTQTASVIFENTFISGEGAIR
ncbi:MAG: hypothetical protein ACLP01_03885 [Solirubrobacteraceae bacterium]